MPGGERIRVTESFAQDGGERRSAKTKKRRRVLSGMRPTGPLHLGHYFGALSNWVRMQNEYDCFYFVADWHALTTHYAEDTRLVPQNTLEIALDWLSAGIDPEKSTLFVQSMVPEHAELHLLLSMITPLEWLERVPTYKEQISQLREKDLGTYGFLGYPLLQTADIVMYDADLVPVGEDQVPHVELSREIVRRFNLLFGVEIKVERLRELVSAGAPSPWIAQFAEARRALTADAALPEVSALDVTEIMQTVRRRASEDGIKNFLEANPDAREVVRPKPALVEPAALLTETPRFPGTDGRRMAKSYGNDIRLRDEPDVIRKKVLGMMTDPQRVRRTDPGRPEICPVFAYHKIFSTPDVIDWAAAGCRSAGIGCVECKRAMAENLVRWIAPVQERRKQFEADPNRVREILAEGSKRAQKVARRTMKRVREAIFGPAGQPSRGARIASSRPEPVGSDSE
jgi:tryptophanyl-tRNA synthetase